MVRIDQIRSATDGHWCFFFAFYFLRVRNTSLSKARSLVGSSALLGLVEHVGQTALAAVLAVKVRSHEDARTTLSVGALATQALDLAVVIDLVELKDGELDLLVLVLDLLGLGVNLLLALLRATAETKHQVKGRLCAQR
jgi:hypothetical protein